MPRWNNIILNQKLITRKHSNPVKCPKCNRPLEVNEKCVAHNRKTMTEYYHDKCYESLWL